MMIITRSSLVFKTLTAGFPHIGLDISSANINAALEQALGHLSAKTLIGHNGYPHLFDNPGHLTFQSDCHGPYYGFPLVKDGLYTGGDPGSDRIIIGNWDGTNARFCGEC